jgi:hypothetical protein
MRTTIIIILLIRIRASKKRKKIRKNKKNLKIKRNGVFLAKYVLLSGDIFFQILYGNHKKLDKTVRFIKALVGRVT